METNTQSEKNTENETAPEVLAGNTYPVPEPRADKDRINWYSADLETSMRLAAEYVEGLLDADMDDEPYFYVKSNGYSAPAEALHALEIGIPHVTGRAIDCLFNVENTTGRRIDRHAEEAYTDYFFSCMEEIGLPIWYDKNSSRKGMEPHNLRESCEALAWLVRSRNDSEAKKAADRFLSILESIMPDHCGYITAAAVSKAGLGSFFPGNCNHPSQTGRLVGALLNLYDATGDERAFTLAGDIAKHATEWFDSETGSMANAGTHIHSITSTLSGLLEYGYLADDEDLIELVEAVYESDQGLKLVMSTSGWIKEQINVAGEVQGEVNQIGDIIQVQLLYGKHELSERAEWYGEAEKFMRSALLPSQVLDNSLCMTASGNEVEDKYLNMDKRMIGGFGFPMPSAHLQGRNSPIDTIDITQGAVQAIAYFTRHITYLEDNVLYVNLLFDWENDVAKVESRLPLMGKVQVTPKQDGQIRIRAYDGIGNNSIRVYKDGTETEFRLVNGYIVIDDVKNGEQVFVDFDIESRSYTESFYVGTPQECEYTLYWYGEQVVAVSPIVGVYPLYEGWPLEIEGLELSWEDENALTEEKIAQGYLAFVPLNGVNADVDARGSSPKYLEDEERGKCLTFTLTNGSADHGILLDMFFAPPALNANTDSLAFWLYVDDVDEVTPLIVEFASAPIHAGEEMLQVTIDLPRYAKNGSLNEGWNPIVLPISLKNMAFSVTVNCDNHPDLSHVFRVRIMNGQNGSGHPLIYKLDDVAFVRGDALQDYRSADGSGLRN